MKPKKLRFNPVLVGLAALVVAVLAGIVFYFNNREIEPVARPCLMLSAAEAHPNATEISDLYKYAEDVPNADDLADEADVICVLEPGKNDNDGRLTMRYYEDDDGFKDFVPYALATRHVRHMIGHNVITGIPDVGQQYALRTLMMVSPEGKVYPLYEPDKNSNTRWIEDRTPDSQASVTVTEVRFGGGGAIKLSDAFKNVPRKYIKGTSSAVINTVGGTFEKLRDMALTPTGADEDKRSTRNRQPQGTVTTTTTTTRSSRTS